MNTKPHHWKNVRLGDHCSLQNGYPFKSDQFNENEGVPLIRVRSLKVHNGDIKIQGNFDESYIVNNEDILIGMDGDFQPCLWRGGKALLNQRVCRLRNFGGDLDKEYVYHAIGKPLEKIENSTFYTTVKHLSSSKILDIKIPLPPLPEQRAIARALSAVQGAREARLREVALERGRKAALMEHLFTHGTRGEATKITEIGEMPESWNLSTIDELKVPFKGSLVAGPFGSNIGKRFFVKSGIPVIRGNNLTKGEKYFIDDGFVFITDEKADELKSCVSLTNDLIFTAAGTLGQIGIIPIDCRYSKYIISNKQIRLRANNLILIPLFLFYWISTSIMQYIIKKENSGTSIPVLNLGVVKRLSVPLPGISEQNEICNYIQIMDSKIAALDHEARLLQELLRAILEELMSGRLQAGALAGPEGIG
jgi:restriction endonuclease S subunit